MELSIKKAREIAIQLRDRTDWESKEMVYDALDELCEVLENCKWKPEK